MAKITTYPKVSELSDDDILLVDGSTGTRTISASDAARDFSSKAPIPDTIYGAHITDTASGSIASFDDGADNIPMKDVLVHVEPVQEGSGDPSPENVRPIIGWTGAKVTRAGRNMLPPAVAFTEKNNGVTLTSDGRGNYTVIGATGDNSASFTFDLTGTLPWNGTEYVHLRNTVASPNLTFSLVDEDSTTSYFGFAPINRIINLSDVTWAKKGQVINKLNVYVTKNTTVNFTISPSVELSGDATDYEPYTGYDTYDITFPSEAGTVYGGELDVTKGELVVDRVMINLGAWNWTMNSVSQGNLFRTPSIVNAVLQYDGLNIICSNYPTVKASQRQDKTMSIGLDNRVDIIDSNYSDASAFKTAMNGVQLVYELATPITYQLTPQEITSLLGTNNLWADTGNSEVEYRVDTKMYIDRKVAELQALILENGGN